MAAENKLAELRKAISQLDTLLLTLLELSLNPDSLVHATNVISSLEAIRLKIALAIEREKRELGLPIHCPEYESQKLARLQEQAKELGLNVSPEQIKAFFLEIFSQSRLAQEQQRELAQAG